MQMSSQNESPHDLFGHKVRVRVCGILIEDQKVLLAKHQSIGPAGYLWSPPGGGVDFGKSLHETLKQEFLEETNLAIEVEDFLFVNEFIKEQYHAIEVFFSVKSIGGTLKLGIDPELSPDQQILTELKFFNKSELDAIPQDAIHNAFITTGARDEINDLRGFITFMD